MFTYSDELYSDLYKDARGFRPGDSGFEYWYSLTPEEKQVQWDGLIREMNQQMEEERLRQQLAINRFEEQVKSWVNIGAKTRENAIRWLHDAEETDGDNDYLCYKLGLPYGYLSKV